MKEYHKIVTVLARDPNTKFRTLTENWACTEFKYLSQNEWIWTEKIDGTNVRIGWEDGKVLIRGKTDNAQLHISLIEYLQSKIYAGVLERVFSAANAYIYGEGYGVKIQNGGGYLPDGVSFITYDININGIWLERRNVEGIANSLELDIVPIVDIGTLTDAISLCKNGFASNIGSRQAEGLVMRPSTELLDRKGGRIITKIKYKDFK